MIETQDFQASLGAALDRPDPAIPGLPEVALRVVRRLADLAAPGVQVARLVGADPALAATLLRSANSVAYNPTGVVTSELPVAVGRLGFDTVRRMTLFHALQQVRDAPRYRVVHERLAQIWQRSVLTASIARVLAVRLGGVTREAATTAGLLHSVGRVWVTACAAAQPTVLQDPVCFESVVERWQAPAARRLLTAWDMDAALVQAVADHGSAESLTGGVGRLTDLLFVCQLFGAFRDAPLELAERLAVSPAAARLGMRGHERNFVFDHSAEEVRAVREALCD
ncbi:MAG: HDOD domain-containing protein [Gammaproteobacteria bacterium]